jgi:hypothetical protein
MENLETNLIFELTKNFLFKKDWRLKGAKMVLEKPAPG